jgi:phosphoribosyl-ATP pyrophosphohydrolase
MGHVVEQPDATETLTALEAVVASRRGADPAESYSARLLADPELIQRKVMEEAFELCLEVGRTPRSERTAEEAADLLYHVVVALVSSGTPIADVVAELESRRR